MKTITMLATFPLLIIGWLGGSAVQAQDLPANNGDLEKRVRELEGIVRNLQQEIPPPWQLADLHKAREPLAGWDNGFFLRSADKAHAFRITGQIQTDYRDFLNSRNTTDIDTFLARRVRFGLEATVAKYYEFRLLPDFGQGQTVIQDAFLNTRYCDELQFQIGKFKEPFSYEQLIQDRFVPTLERSLIDNLAPARDVGFAVHGKGLFGDQLDYALGIFNGEINGDWNISSNLDFAGRLAWRPFRMLDSETLLYNLQIGISGTVGTQSENVSSTTPNQLDTPATVLWFQFNSTVVADGLRSRYSPELGYFYGSLGFMAQYFHQNQEFRPSSNSPVLIDVPFNGYQCLVSYLLTGEQRTTYSAPVVPYRDFDLRSPLRNPGAFELVGRVSRLHVGEQALNPQAASQLADPTKFSPGATEMTLGFNWYWNAWVRWQFNWERAWFDEPVQLGVGKAGLLQQQDSLLTRFQLIF